MTTITFEDVTVRFGHGRSAFTALHGVSLDIPEGSSVGLVGESGSGKSTLARAAVGLHEPSSGRILLDGVDVVHAKGKNARRRQQIQMIFQDPNSCLDPRYTIGESIAEAITAYEKRSGDTALSRHQRVHEVRRLLATVQLDPDRHDAYPHEFSGGQRQRIALARALAARPTVLMADEITSALDVSVQGSVLNLLADIQRDLGLTVLFISHNLAVVRHVCDYVAVMYHGEIVEYGPVLDVLETPSHPYTRDLIAAVPQVGVPLFLDLE